MQIDFLAASDGTRLTKTFRRVNGKVETTPYPHVRNFTSRHYEPADLTELYSILQAEAETGSCLLKGRLNHQLTDESRAGSTDSTGATDWLLLDLDFSDGWNSVDDLLIELDPALADVSYIFHHSGSAGIKNKPGLRGHVLIRLANTVAAPAIKDWLIAANLRVPGLRGQIELNASGMALRYPLDITTCQNDKLIFTADPVVEGMEDPLAGKRFQLVTKTHETAALSLTSNPGANQDQAQDLVEELRKKAGMRKRAPRYKRHGVTEILTNPNRATVTSEMRARGFVYVNLNNGDSFAYYYPEDNPDLLYNFKGEPVMRLGDVDPDYYARNKPSAQLPDKSITPIAFRDRTTDAYWNGLYDSTNDVLDLHQTGSKDKIRDFVAQFGEEPPERIEDWTLDFDPTTTRTIDINARWANLYSPTEYRRNPGDPVARLPRTIDKVLSTITAHDAEVKHRFLNWLAFIFQTGRKSKTAWIFHGVPGTGKGLLFSKILEPLFGPRHVFPMTSNLLEDKYNDYLKANQILWIDESNSDSAMSDTIMDKLKNWITEDSITMRAMRMNSVKIPNYSNLIFASNRMDPVSLEPNDRRFNVAPRARQKLEISDFEVSLIADELPMLAGYLWHYEVDVHAATHIMLNQAREDMIAAATPSHDRFFQAIEQGDLDYFLEFIKPAGNSADPAYMLYEQHVMEWCQQIGQNVLVPRDHLLDCYRYLQHAHNYSVNKFSRMCRTKGLGSPQPYRMPGGRAVKAFRINWTGDEVAAKALLDSANKVTKLHG